MNVFVTGATGFIGSALVPELLRAGHSVLGLTRTEKGADALRAAGARAHLGTLEDLGSLRSGTEGADGVVHLAFNHDDLSKFQEYAEIDRRATGAMAEALAGSGRPFVGIGGVIFPVPGLGRPFGEDDDLPETGFPRDSEAATLRTLERGVRGIVVRMSQIHDPRRQGLVTYLVQTALEKGVSAYVGDGGNRWAAAHVSDTARLLRLALERGEAGTRWHAVGEEGVPMRAIAEAIGRRLGVPAVSIAAEEAPAHFGFLGGFVRFDSPASNEKTRERLGWQPTGPGLIEDLDRLVLPGEE